jgi:phosphonate transport system ATP-binding protein
MILRHHQKGGFPMLQLDSLRQQFNDIIAVRDVSLQIQPGYFVGVIGRSGAGKSTLLRMINRLNTPTAGRIIYAGKDMTTVSGAELRAWRRSCAMIFQQFNLVGRMDVLTNVLTGRLAHASHLASLLNVWSDADKAIALSALEQFDMAHLAAQRVDQLSGGQQQRVAICRALVQEPDIILADEPIASLDPRNTKVVMDALLRINKQFGITVICNLHSLDLARLHCTRLVGLAAGRLVFDGKPTELTDAVAQALYGIEANEVRDIPAESPIRTHLQPPPTAALA